ncbi:hypothetical protein A2529_05045 [Candidatus Peribacteria bacterium RIFOXYD2_FULL_58_15]|nr:MAG: hypothetical protein A2529_05045 [Candidatus Peribacteria bacterium RIFOXYD2_FULL_58_15]
MNASRPVLAYLREEVLPWIAIVLVSLIVGLFIHQSYGEIEGYYLVSTFWAFLLVVSFYAAGLAWKENEKLKRENEHMKRDVEYQRSLGN